MPVGARLAARLDMFRHGVGGQHKQRRAVPATLRLEGPDLSRGGQSVHHRHLHVHEDQVETSTPEGLERLAPIRDANQIGAGPRQQNLDDLAVGGMIVRQQNP